MNSHYLSANLQVSKELLVWVRRGNTNNDEQYSGNRDFTRQAILSDEGVRKLMDHKWQTLRRTHPQTTRNQFDQWTTRLWNSWVREKKKLAMRKVTEVRRRPQRNRRIETPPMKPDQDYESPSMLDTVTPDTPSLIQNVKARVRTASILPAPLLPPATITSKPSSPSTRSTSVTPRKRSHDELSASRPSPVRYECTSEIERFLTKQLKDNLIQGSLSPAAVLSVLEECEIDTSSMLVGTASLLPQ